MGIADRLDEAMRRRRLTNQSALSRLSGVTQPTINRILQGGTTPNFSTIKKLAATLDVSPVWLAGGSADLEEGTLPKTSDWPLRIEKARVDALTSADKAILDQIIEATVTAMEAKRAAAAKRTKPKDG